MQFVCCFYAVSMLFLSWPKIYLKIYFLKNLLGSKQITHLH